MSADLLLKPIVQRQMAETLEGVVSFSSWLEGQTGVNSLVDSSARHAVDTPIDGMGLI